jgi:uncharacterized protein YkwD/uncharacterized membrane protein required for colicin V production
MTGLPEPVASWLAGLQAVDIVLLGILALFALDGVRRGFIASALGLLGIAATIAVAVQWYPVVASLLAEQTDWPPLITSAAAFLAVLLAAQIAVVIAVKLILLVLRPVRLLLGPLKLADHALGIVPGLLQGLLVAALLVTGVRLFPFVPGLAAAFERSDVASAIASRADQLTPLLTDKLADLAQDGVPFPARILHPDEEIRIPAQQSLSPDPAMEEAMLALVNAERSKEGLRPLAMDAQLRTAARGHSAEMFRLGYFSHTSPVSGTPADRVRRLAVPFTITGENIAYAPALELAHAGLMASPHHRRNILDPTYTRVGIGVVSAGLAGRMFSQSFAG